jgi:Leucine-rich repeat (LRR) protein
VRGLDLSHTPSPAFSLLPRPLQRTLLILNLSHCGLTSCKEIAATCVSVRFMNLTDNKISTVEDVVGKMKHLEELYMS